MSNPNTLLVDGTDLRSLTGIKIVGSMQLYAPGTRRGDALTVPRRRGQRGVQRPLDAYAFSISIQVSGASREEMVANLLALGPAIGGTGTGGLVSLERRLAKVGGGYTAHTAAGQFAAFNTFSLLGNSQLGQTELQYVNLDGAWWDATSSTWLVP